MPRVEMENKKFGRLTVVSFSHKEKNKIMWNCKCECGNEVVKDGMLIRLGKTLSCGCLKKDVLVKRNTTHGQGHSKMNMVWQEMKSRCNNVNHKYYENYGGRGIKVCEEWNEYINFYNDMHESYVEGLTLDRIDNNKGYSKENCRWISYLGQNNNKRNNVYETVEGITATRSQLADMYGVPRCTFYWRLNHGKTVEEALGIKKS